MINRSKKKKYFFMQKTKQVRSKMLHASEIKTCYFKELDSTTLIHNIIVKARVPLYSFMSLPVLILKKSIND